MSKTKMRCNTCGKWFQSANARDLTCPDCMQKARKEKMAAKNAPPPTTRQPGLGSGNPNRAVPPPPKPKPAASGTSQWLDTQNDVRIGQPDQPPPRPKLPSPPVSRDNRGTQEYGGNRGTGDNRDERGFGQGGGSYRDNRGPGGYRENDYRSPAPYRVGGGMGLPDTIGQQPRQPMPGGPPRERGPRPGGPGEPRPRQGGKPMGQKKAPTPKQPAPPKPKREKIPPPEPFKPTEEQIAQVEARYKELAVPAEYDGIRTQIAQELSIPKSAVKKIVKDFRDKEHIPSWWELQTYKGNAEELEQIKAVYVPFLPVPPIGVHKQIAEQLSLKPVDVYQAIKAIRQEMNLPQYNDPALHGLEPILPDQKMAETSEAAATPVDEAETPAEVATTSNGPATSEATETATSESETPEPVATALSELEKQEDVAVVTTTSHAPEKQEDVSVADTPVEEIGSHGEVSSIETDTPLHKEDGTIEIGVTGSADANNATEA